MRNGFFLLPGLLIIICSVQAQLLKPGFHKQEYTNLMKVSAQFGDSAYSAAIPPPRGYQFVYQSPVLGLDNRWQLWKDDRGAGIISIRGTTVHEVSWLANFYMAMVPAKGVLQLGKDQAFPYELAANPRAAVHVGWLVSTGFLSKDIVARIDSCYKKGMKDFYIMGHSQGGAIAYLLTAYLNSLQQQQQLPSDIRFKTYCSAAPKPGNLYFAYAYEALTHEGWAYNVVSSADWVPETPVSIQTVTDFNNINPFVNTKGFISKQKWPKRWVLRYAYGRLTRPGEKAARNYRNYLGKFVSKPVKKHLKGFTPPAYAKSMDYVRTGNTIVLLADADYFRQYPQDNKKIFMNHFHAPYLYLTGKLELTNSAKPVPTSSR